MQSAIKDYQKSLALDPDFMYGHIQLGVAQYKAGDINASKSTFNDALKRFKSNGEIFNYHGEILLDMQQFDDGKHQLF